ncbi:MAG: 4-hydroxy-3-methylbut-2-enyl diphosphate reductase [Flavobacteriales bacterium]|nr:4-hydroxy-3-methylbut-2-enyl diphosphate reductase [Flavobacteriales bacterium]
MKKFQIPLFYNSNIIDQIRRIRESKDPRKKDLSPSLIKIDNIHVYIGRHFGFCYGVKNAIEICYQTIEKYPNKRIFLLSQMIHNQAVNDDLLENGVSFIMDTHGNQLIKWDNINQDDIIIIPAFGTSLEILEILKEKNINTEKFDTTCPFVEKVWNRLEQISRKGFTVVIYGTAQHEETRSTFSRAKKYGPSIIVEDIEEVQILCNFMSGKESEFNVKKIFQNKCSENFNFKKDLAKLGVVNQTTMLASETKHIIDLFTNTLVLKHGEENIKNYIANTRDTLCYATNENQESTLRLLREEVDLAIIVGGYNSSNTTHLVELTSEKTEKTYFINSAKKILPNNSIKHFDIALKKEIITKNFLPKKECKVLLTSGASCPDILLENIIMKLTEINNITIDQKAIIKDFEMRY